jgi:hypothetical protein
MGWQVASNVVLGIGCFLLAWAAFDPFCDRAPESATAIVPAQGRFFGLRLSRPPRPWKDALMWKDFYFLCGGHIAFILRTLAYGCALAPFVYRSNIGWTQFGVFEQIFSTAMPFFFSIDIAVMASRIFRLELRDQTLAALATLPLSMPHIAYRKTFACVLAAAPGIVATLSGQLWALQHSSAAQLRMPVVFSMSLMMTVKLFSSWVQALLIVHVVAWLSLYMKRGALPLGFVLTYALNTLFSIVFVALVATRAFAAYAANSSVGTFSPSISFIYWSPICAAVISLVVAGILHYRSLRQLELLAGES